VAQTLNKWCFYSFFFLKKKKKKKEKKAHFKLNQRVRADLKNNNNNKKIKN
jgi:hypothetical protein